MKRTFARNKARNLARLAPALLIASALAPAVSAQAPTLSKEYIRLGDRILAIESAAGPYVATPVYENYAWRHTEMGRSASLAPRFRRRRSP
jgi:hypothetical protein